MKLLACFKCNDIFSLSREYKECGCKAVSGNYLSDGITADVFMKDRKSGAVLGFANSSITSALREQIINGDLPATMPYCGKIVAPGREFKAFIIPESADSVVWHYATE